MLVNKWCAAKQKFAVDRLQYNILYNEGVVVIVQYLVMLDSHNIWLGNKCVAVYFGGLVILFKLKH